MNGRTLSLALKNVVRSKRPLTRYTSSCAAELQKMVKLEFILIILMINDIYFAEK